MSDEGPMSFEVKEKILRARIDVIEQAFAFFMVGISREGAMAVEDRMRSLGEAGLSSPPVTVDFEAAQQQRLTDQAAIRFSELIAKTLAQHRA